MDAKGQVPREEVDVGADERDPDEDDRVGDLLRQPEADRAQAGHEDELPLEEIGAPVVCLADLGAQLLHALRSPPTARSIRLGSTQARVVGHDEPSRYGAARTSGHFDARRQGDP